MRSYKLLTVFICLTQLAIAQTPMAFLVKEDFTGNQRNWPLQHHDHHLMHLSNGHAELHHHVAGQYFVTKDGLLDSRRDFTIEFKIRTAHNNEGGLVWAAADAKNAHFFSIKNNTFRISYCQKGSLKTEQDFTVSAAIVTQQYNVLTVERKSSKIRYLINGQEVFKGSLNKLDGSQVGLALWDKSSLEADYLYIKEPYGNINIDPLMAFPGVPEVLSDKVNTNYQDLLPVVSPDGRTVYYIGRGYPQNKGGAEDDDIYVTHLDPQGNWTKGQNVGTPLNNEQHNFVCSVSPDGNTLLLGNLYGEITDYSMKGGVSISTKGKNGWNMPENQLIADFYNQSEFGEFYLSSDGKLMLMALKRKDTFGKNDLYVSFNKGENQWSEPLNLGNKLNTKGNEFSPFLAADGKTLYFSSEGQPGYGSADVFVTKRLDDSWKSWSLPQNLGPVINTDGFEAFYTIPASGNYAYYVKSSETTAEDIYRIELPAEIRPEPVALLKGLVRDAHTKAFIEAEIICEDLTNHIQLDKHRSDAQKGSYQIVLTKGKNYGLHAKAKGYIPVNESFDLRVLTTYQEIEKDLWLVPIEVGQSVKLNNVFFYQSKAELLPSSNPELERLAEIMLENPTMKIRLNGHTDNQGIATLNLKLSEDRVAAVKEFLVKQGVDPNRIEGKGHGSTKPVSSNDTEEGRKQNRRVEFIIIHK